MPLLVCPNDDAAMQNVRRDGVEFDFCPTCRGIWLDRGELEKLMAAARDEGVHDAPPPDRPSRRDAERDWREADRGRDRSYDEPRRYRDDDDDDRGRRRKRGFDIFDIFD